MAKFKPISFYIRIKWYIWVDKPMTEPICSYLLFDITYQTIGIK